MLKSKRFKMVLCLVILSLVLVVSNASAVIIHVSPGEIIQAAVDSACPGDKIIVHAGEYHQSVVIRKNNLTLKGEEGTVLDGDGPADTGTSLTGACISLVGVSGVTIRDFEIRDYGKYGIVLSASSNNVVEKNNISQGDTIGIALWNSSNNTVVHNNVANIRGYHGYGIILGPGSNGPSNNNVIQRNNVSGIISGDGIHLVKSSNNVVGGNVISNSGRFGIILYTTSSNNMVEKNAVSGSGQSEPGDGIILSWNANDNVIEKNKVSDSSRYGINLEYDSSYNMIKKNQASYSGSYDLRWDGSGTGNVWEQNIYDTATPNLP